MLHDEAAVSQCATQPTGFLAKRWTSRNVDIIHLMPLPRAAHFVQWVIRAVPEIIRRGPRFFFRPLHPQDKHGVRAPRPPGHVSALINQPHYGSNMPWPPRISYTPPLGHVVNKTPSPPQDKNVPAAHPLPPEDNFWNSPNGWRRKGAGGHSSANNEHIWAWSAKELNWRDAELSQHRTEYSSAWKNLCWQGSETFPNLKFFWRNDVKVSRVHQWS